MKMSEPSPQNDLLPMESKSMSSAEVFRASRLVALPEDETTLSISGPKWREWCLKSGPKSSSLKTSKEIQSDEQLNTSSEWGCSVTLSVYQQMISGLTIKECVGGLLHTPTKTANFLAPSMQKHPSCTRYAKAFGRRRISAPLFAFLMGYHPEWTVLQNSETPSSRKSRK